MNVTGGTTDVITYFKLRTAADGTATTGATITDIDLQYTRTGAAPVAKVDATALAATNSAHAANKAIEIDGTSSPGLYRVDWPDAAFAAGVRQVVLSVTLAGSFAEDQVIDIDPPVGAAASVTGAVGSVTGAVGSVTGNVGGSTASVVGAVGSVAGNVDGNVTGSVASVVGAVGSVTGAVGSVTAGVDLSAGAVDDVWDEPLTSATHNVGYSAGQRLRYLILDGATAQAGSTANTLVLSALASAVDHIYNQNIVSIVAGTGAGQTRLIVEYDGGSTTAIVDRPWDVIPDITSVYELLPFSSAVVATHGQATAGGADSITFGSTALAIAGSYVGCTVYILSGTGAGQSRLIAGYTVGRVATVSPAWETATDATSVYIVIPMGRSIVDDLSAAMLNAIADAAWDEAIAGHLGAGTTGAALNGATAPTAGAVADAVWDEANAAHVAAGSTGANLSAAGGGATPATIADAVWDEATADHATAGSAGAAIASASTVVSDLMAHTGITAGGAVSYQTMLKAVYGLARGRIVKSGDAYTFYDDDDSTELYTLTVSSSGRATS